MKVIIGLYSVALVSGLIFIQTVRLILLYNQVARYRNYWQQRATQHGDFVYLALGDSAAQGIGASKPDKGYVGQLADRVAKQTGHKVRVINLSVSGAVIRDVLDKQLPESRKLNIKPDLVTIEIGANDIARFNSHRYTTDYKELVQKLPKNTFVSNMPYFQTRPGRRAHAIAASDIISHAVAKRRDLVLVDLQTITKERSSWFGYAADYFHPTERNYANWVAVFWEKIRGQL